MTRLLTRHLLNKVIPRPGELALVPHADPAPGKIFASFLRENFRRNKVTLRQRPRARAKAFGRLAEGRCWSRRGCIHDARISPRRASTVAANTICCFADATAPSTTVGGGRCRLPTVAQRSSVPASDALALQSLIAIASPPYWLILHTHPGLPGMDQPESFIFTHALLREPSARRRFWQTTSALQPLKGAIDHA